MCNKYMRMSKQHGMEDNLKYYNINIMSLVYKIKKGMN